MKNKWIAIDKATKAPPCVLVFKIIGFGWMVFSLKFEGFVGSLLVFYEVF